MQSVYVDPRFRRRGYYRLLYAHVREAARAEGAAGVRLYVENTNQRAQATVRAGHWVQLQQHPAARAGCPCAACWSGRAGGCAWQPVTCA